MEILRCCAAGLLRMRGLDRKPHIYFVNGLLTPDRRNCKLVNMITCVCFGNRNVWVLTCWVCKAGPQIENCPYLSAKHFWSIRGVLKLGALGKNPPILEQRVVLFRKFFWFGKVVFERSFLISWLVMSPSECCFSKMFIHVPVRTF